MVQRAIDLRLQKPLEDYVEYFDHLTIRSLNLLENCADIAMVFRDPVYNVRGRDSAIKLLRRRFEYYPTAKYKVQDFVWGRIPATAYLRLNFTYTQKGNDEARISVPYMVELGFSTEGKVAVHREFWEDMKIFELKVFQKPL